MKSILKTPRRREDRRARELARVLLRASKPAPRDLIAYAAALEILG
jgi:hypothetical protein